MGKKKKKKDGSVQVMNLARSPIFVDLSKYDGFNVEQKGVTIEAGDGFVGGTKTTMQKEVWEEIKDLPPIQGRLDKGELRVANG